GLGKTIETLLWQAVLACKKCLLIMPASLIGEWQNEIEGMFTRWALKQKVNWKGERIRFDYRIIEYASECKRNALRTINIISYESLRSVPRDATFYVCDTCNTVVCSNSLGTDKVGNPLVGLEAGGKMPCPKCNHGI